MYQGGKTEAQAVNQLEAPVRQWAQIWRLVQIMVQVLIQGVEVVMQTINQLELEVLLRQRAGEQLYSFEKQWRNSTSVSAIPNGLSGIGKRESGWISHEEQHNCSISGCEESETEQAVELQAS